MTLNRSITDHHRHHTQCIPLKENYGQGLEREKRRQFIPIEESAVKESLGSIRVFKGRETCNYPKACNQIATKT